MPIKRVGIISKPKKTEIREIVPPLIAWLRERDIEVFTDKESGSILERQERSLSRNEMPSQVDLLVVLGGDGTLLATARALNRKPVPILAVNMGGLGFLTVITREDLYPTLELLLAGHAQIERRVQIEGELVRADEVISSFLALNDVVLNKGAIARIIDFDVLVDGKLISTYKADGLIVSTPTGSTAYNMSAGGPIMEPTLEAIALTPIAPHSLTIRPIVVRSDRPLNIAAVKVNPGTMAIVDGQLSAPLCEGDQVTISRLEQDLLIVPHPGRTFFQTLTGKLQWGRSPHESPDARPAGG